VFKTIPGNSELEISLEGVIRFVGGLECTLPTNDNKVSIKIYGVDVTVDLTWLSLMAFYEVRLPEEIQGLIWQINFIKVTNTAIRRKLDQLMVFKTPIVINKEYRVIPNFTRYAINSKGILLDLNANEVINVSKYSNVKNKYPTVWIYDPLNGCKREIVLHRLLAYAWIPNKDPNLKCVINHKDGNKQNYKLSNLEWTNHSENANHAFKSGLREDNIRCLVRDVYTKEIKEFPTISLAFKYMGSNTRTHSGVRYLRPTKLINKRYEFRTSDDNRQWFYENIDKPLCPGRYTLVVTYTDGLVETFYDVRSVIKKLKVWNTPSQGVNHVVKRALELYPGITIEVIDNYKTKIIQAYNIKTGKVIEADSIKEISTLLKLPRGIIKSAIRSGENRVSNGFAFRYKTDQPWNTEFTEYSGYPKCILVTHTTTQEKLVFKSMRSLAKHFKVDRGVVVHRLKTGLPFKEWVFTEIDDLET
jgi:hypothetical protein